MWRPMAPRGCHLDAYPFTHTDRGKINLVMKDATQRSIFRWIHILFSIPILGYIYSPFEKLPDYAPPTRYVFLPVMVLSSGSFSQD